ncbi:sulfate/molybdate ABC transporter ATP-binding protein [Telmatocola sphagniphila]|jgi:sulfate transport system ATP-binding protein|uniref:Sulfate/molybdate ABC transporter ATP-binding protein n=1 Tax=Telmatocola sphagniphila TaxID=1123043 RepID=A0A8E6EZ71_9BACT|nr:sulfate/molybdate ABC transporter ATP-binding protein [Telmatocola sphagniphila]QVL33131.1 sulfate/molybdate ABC transporter ATP-binding protein [Telmatocola sphagniphila]
MSIAVRNVSKKFGVASVLDRVSFEAKTGTLVALLGPSGSGKTTLLRIIAGLENPDSGNVLYQDDDVTQSSARERNVGFVFQHYALFRHMTVFENVAFGLRVRHWAEPRIKERVFELLKLVRLEDLAGRYPSQLSGGQKQRIALIRALAPQPRVILLDEPFGALDAKVRMELRTWLRRFHDEFHVTSIFVTHDQEEAFEVADQIVVMNQGKIEQTGTPVEVFEHPANAFVMDFLGNVNIFPVRLQDGRAMLGKIEMPLPSMPMDDSEEARVYIRPHELEIDRIRNNNTCLEVKILHINPAGSVVKVRLISEEYGLTVNVDVSPERYAALKLRSSDMVYISPKKARMFAPDYTI